MRHLKRFESGLAFVEKAFLVAFLTVMVLLSFAQVVMRQTMGTGLLWGDTLSRHMVLWVGFLGAALAAAEGKHFAWETAVAALKGKPQAVARTFASLSCVVIAILLARASWMFFVDDRASGNVLFTVAGHSVPSWAYSMVYPGGFALLALHFFIAAVLTLGGQPAPSENHAASGPATGGGD